MEIGLVYSSKDPRQTLTRDFVVNFLNERGVLADFNESDQPVEIPTITINGCEVKPSDTGRGVRGKGIRFPSLDDIIQALERGIWCL